MSDYLLPALVLAALVVWWFSSRSLVGAVARTPETEAALEEVAARVAQTLRAFDIGPHEVAPVWAHGCPCVRVSFPDTAGGGSSPAAEQAREAAARSLEDAMRTAPAFSHIASRYSSKQGLHWC